jgi:hypothetical protein
MILIDTDVLVECLRGSAPSAGTTGLLSAMVAPVFLQTLHNLLGFEL